VPLIWAHLIDGLIQQGSQAARTLARSIEGKDKMDDEERQKILEGYIEMAQLTVDDSMNVLDALREIEVDPLFGEDAHLWASLDLALLRIERSIAPWRAGMDELGEAFVDKDKNQQKGK
jgi:hypothetical protein